jgi:6-phosphogluconolactonase
MDLEIYKDIDDLMKALANAIYEASEEAIAARGRFNFVLSGGSSPRKLYKILSSQPYKNKINWSKTYFFFGDERFVPENDSQRNSLMAKEVLFDPLKIESSHIFMVNTNFSPEVSAQQYADSILEHFQNKPIKFDFILLGLGDDAHTASLFPNTSVLNETQATVKSVFLEKLDMYRITMTAPLINQARHIAFLVYGKNKAEAVYRVLVDESGSSQKYPARLINSEETRVQWFLDPDAISLI